MEGIRNAIIPIIIVATPHTTKIVAIPIISASRPVANKPIIEGNKLMLSNREKALPKKEGGINVCNKAVKGPE